MSSRQGILCLHVFTYTSSSVFLPCTMYRIRSKCVLEPYMIPHLSRISVYWVYIFGRIQVRCLYGTFKDLLHFSVGEEEAVYSTATAQIHLEMWSKHTGTEKMERVAIRTMSVSFSDEPPELVQAYRDSNSPGLPSETGPFWHTFPHSICSLLYPGSIISHHVLSLFV